MWKSVTPPPSLCGLSRIHPSIDLAQLELPQATHLSGRHAFALNPDIDGFPLYAQVLSHFFD